MNKRAIKISLGIILLLFVGYFWKAFIPNQKEYAVNKYFESQTYHIGDSFYIHSVNKWHNGEIVAIENEKMVGVAYLEKRLGVYSVKNHALLNKVDFSKPDFMEDYSYQYRVLKAKEFVEGKDILVAYIKDGALNTFNIKNDSSQVVFTLPQTKKIVVGEIKHRVSIIGSDTDIEVIGWTDKRLEDFIKYERSDLVLQSEKKLMIAHSGSFPYKIGNNIETKRVSLDQLSNLDAEEYDVLIINKNISEESLDILKDSDWHVVVLDPKENYKTTINHMLDEDIVAIEIGKATSGTYRQDDLRDSSSNHYIALQLILEHLERRK